MRHIDADTMLTLIYKWGCDGSSGHSTYKQKFSEEENMYQQDNNLFVISMVPLRLSNGTDIVWQNPQPSVTVKRGVTGGTVEVPYRQLRTVAQGCRSNDRTQR